MFRSPTVCSVIRKNKNELLTHVYTPFIPFSVETPNDLQSMGVQIVWMFQNFVLHLNSTTLPLPNYLTPSLYFTEKGSHCYVKSLLHFYYANNSSFS